MIAEQVVAALDGQSREPRSTSPSSILATSSAIGPFVPLAAKLGRLAMALAGAWPRA